MLINVCFLFLRFNIFNAPVLNICVFKRDMESKSSSNARFNSDMYSHDPPHSAAVERCKLCGRGKDRFVCSSCVGKRYVREQNSDLESVEIKILKKNKQIKN